MSLWEPFEAWLRENPSEDASALNDGASEAALDALEATLGLTLPRAFRVAWAEHDGETPGAQTLVRMHHLLPLSAIRSEWRTMNEALDAGAAGGPENVCEAGPGVRALYWSPRWIPFVLLGGATDFHCLDLDPGEGGVAGQVIHVSDDLIPREVVAADLASYFAQLERALRGAPETSAPPPRPPTLPPPGSLRGFALRVLLAAGFWVSVWHAVSTRRPAWIAATAALWLLYVVSHRHAARSDLSR